MSETVPQPFRQGIPRASEELIADCFAVPLVFEDDALWPAALVEDMAKHNGIPCEGSGVPGAWCHSCRFGVVEEA